MAFAIIETGAKQYRVAEGDLFSAEKIKGHSEGDTITFDKVLAIDDGTKTTLGNPYIKGAAVEVTLQTVGKGKKLYVQKFKAKSRYKRRLGHRQPYSALQVTNIKQ